MKILPIGAIIIFNGNASTIPDGWFICNGSNGTPDLRDMFVLGASSDGEVGSTGTGVHSHTRPSTTSSDGAHSHTMSISLSGASGSTSNVGANQYGNDAATSGHGHSGGSGLTGSAVAHPHTLGGSTYDQTNNPPYMKLYYIMRVE